MAADFRLVVHAAETDADEFAAHGARDRLAERGLADAGRPDEAQDRRLALRRELAHGEIFDDPPLDLVEVVMVLVEDAPRLDDVDRLLLRQRPRQLDQPIEISAHHAVFAGGFRHALQPAQFLARLVLDLLRHAGIGDRLFEFGDLGGLALLALAELPLNRRHLLAQQHLALTLVERRLGLRGRFPATAAAPRCDGRAASAPCPCARRGRASRGSPASLPASRPCRRQPDRRAPTASRSTGSRRAGRPAPAAAAAIASSVCAFRLTKRASISAVRASGSGICSTRATRNGQPVRYSTIWNRCSPWQIR